MIRKVYVFDAARQSVMEIGNIDGRFQVETKKGEMKITQ